MSISLLHRLRHAQFNSALGRALLHLVYKDGKSYRLPFGQLRGQRLYYDSSVNFHAILGLWDHDMLEVMKVVFEHAGLAGQPITIADVGANIGFISLWFSRMTLGQGQIYSFEPSPCTYSMLARNIALNERLDIHPIPLACSNQVGQTTFFIAKHHHSSSLLSEWAWEREAQGEQLVVNTTTLDQFFLSEKGVAPDIIKMDIEGGGVYALAGVDGCVRAKQPLFWVESHTPEEDAAVSRILTTYDYTGYRLSDRQFVKRPAATYPDPDGVQSTMLLIPPRLREQLTPALRALS